MTKGNWRKIFLVLIAASAVGIVCSARAGAATAKSVKTPAAQREAKTDPAEWKKVLEAAKKEGKIVICGAPGEGWRRSLVDAFQQEYPEISVEFTAMAGRNFWQRVRTERDLGKKLWDLRSGGMDQLSI